MSRIIAQNGLISQIQKWGRIPVFLAATGLLLGACTQLPTAELSHYRSAFLEVNSVKDDVLIDFGIAVRAAKSFSPNTAAASRKVVPQSPFSSSLSKGTDGPEATEVRRTAWGVIERFNGALTDLAEGKSDTEVKNAVGGFGSSIGKFSQVATGSAIPGLSAIIEVAQIVAVKVEKARRAKEFKRAVRAGYPLINSIFDALYADVDDQFDIIQGLARDDFNIQTAALTTSIGSLYLFLGSLEKPVAEPASGAAMDLDGDAFMSEANKQLNEALFPLARQLMGYPYTLAWADQNSSPFTYQAKNTVELRLNEIGARAAAMVALVQEIEAKGDLLRAYQKLLIQTKDTLRKLEIALDAPINIETEASELITTVFRIKQGLETYRSTRIKSSAAKSTVSSVTAPAASP